MDEYPPPPDYSSINVQPQQQQIPMNQQQPPYPNNYWNPSQQPNASYPTNAGGFTAPQQPTVAPPIQQQPRPTVTIIHQNVLFGRFPIQTTCANCRQSIQTVTRHAGSNGAAYLTCCCLFWFGCWPCCFIPFCMDSFQNIEHSCPNCNVFIGATS